jgi:trans-aconitate methyltransferase
MPTDAYSMQMGDAAARRLQLRGQFYDDPMSSAFLEAAGVRPGDTVADLGCGHGGVTERIASRIGDAGRVYVVDSSPEQLRIACTHLADRPNVTFIQASLEEAPAWPARRLVLQPLFPHARQKPRPRQPHVLTRRRR